MNALATAADDYLAARRAVGYKLDETGRVLTGFVAHLDSIGAVTITVTAAVAWASNPPGRSNIAQRLSMIRGFARYLQALEPAHEIPPAGLIPNRTRRRVPYLYADTDTTALMNAARLLEPPIWAETCETVIGLLAVTGCRIGELLRLNTIDIDWDSGVATVWLTKFNKSRHVPLDPTTMVALARYDEHRHQRLPTSTTPALFVSLTGRRLRYTSFAATFATLLDTAGVTTVSGRPRIHDFRHSFATRTLLEWYRNGADVHAMLPRLSTYLGHVSPSTTYWYLSAAPELMAIAAEQLDQHREDHQ